YSTSSKTHVPERSKSQGRGQPCARGGGHYTAPTTTQPGRRGRIRPDKHGTRLNRAKQLTDTEKRGTLTTWQQHYAYSSHSWCQRRTRNEPTRQCGRGVTD